MKDEQLQIAQTFEHMIHEHPDDIIMSEVVEQKTGKTYIVVSIVNHLDNDEEVEIYPIAVLFNQEDNPFQIYDFGDGIEFSEDKGQPKFVQDVDNNSWWSRIRNWWWSK